MSVYVVLQSLLCRKMYEFCEKLLYFCTDLYFVSKFLYLFVIRLPLDELVEVKTNTLAALMFIAPPVFY